MEAGVERLGEGGKHEGGRKEGGKNEHQTADRLFRKTQMSRRRVFTCPRFRLFGFFRGEKK